MKNLSLPWAGILIVGLAAAYLSATSVTVMMVLLVAWSLRGPAQSIQSLTLTTLLTYLTPAIAEIPPDAGIIGRVVLIAAALRVLPSLRSEGVRQLWPVWLFSAIAATLSIFTSSSVPISIMKVVTFAVTVSTVLTAYNLLSVHQISRLQGWFATLGLVFVTASLLTLAVPRVAYLRNGTGLQGILNHPQAFGVALAPLAAWQLTGVLFIRGNLRWFGVAVGTLIYVALFLSEARTGMAASLMGVVAAAITWLFSSQRGAVLAGRMPVFAVGGGIGLILAASLASGHLQEKIVKFAFKHSESRAVSDAFFESRGSNILSQWLNFANQPWLGHGFGVYAEGPPASSVVEFFGVPISAPIEKGFVFTAVLEETGVIGGLSFLLMLVSLARYAWRNADVRWIAMFITCIGVNIGECIIVAPGGIGLFDWLLIGLALSSARMTSSAAETISTEPAALRFPNLLRL